MLTDNFWDTFNKQCFEWEQIRVCDGMLFTTIIQHLESLKDSGAVGSMMVLDYDHEPHSTNKYGQILEKKVPNYVDMKYHWVFQVSADARWLEHCICEWLTPQTGEFSLSPITAIGKC